MFVFMFFVALAWGQTATTESALDLANARLINAEAALVEARAAVLDDLMVSAADLSTDEQCGKAPKYGGPFVGENALQLRALRNECLRIKGEATYARVAETGQVLGQGMYGNAKRGTLATGDRAATMAAANDVPEGAGFNGPLNNWAVGYQIVANDRAMTDAVLTRNQIPIVIAGNQTSTSPSVVRTPSDEEIEAAQRIQAAARQQ
jgi:hypothetical protein